MVTRNRKFISFIHIVCYREERVIKSFKHKTFSMGIKFLRKYNEKLDAKEERRILVYSTVKRQAHLGIFK